MANETVTATGPGTMVEPTGRVSQMDAALLGGALAGLLSGILMAIAAGLYAWVAGMGTWTPLQMIGGAYYGPMAFVGGAGVDAVAAFTHLGVATALGIVFALLTLWMRSSGVGVIVGIVYGICVWAFMTWVILPVFDATMAARVPMIPVWWFFLHWIYGGLLGIFTPPLRRAFGYCDPASAPRLDRALVGRSTALGAP